jgi:hypothetical protein
MESAHERSLPLKSFRAALATQAVRTVAAAALLELAPCEP